MSDEPLDPITSPDETQPLPAAPAAEPEPQTLAQELEAWENELEIWFQDWRQNFHEFDTELHNKFFNAKEELKKRLHGLIA